MAGWIKALSGLLSITDEQAMWRVKLHDDPQAFALLVERWERQIQSLCARMTGDAHRAEDLAQEAFARVFAARKKYETSGKFSTFLWRIALNLCYDELRKIKRRGEQALADELECGESHQLVASESTPDIRLVENERAEAVRQALGQLAEPYRVVVVLRHYEGLKFREISAVLDLPEGTVKSRMAEALSQLSRLLHQQFIDGDRSCNPTKLPNPALAI